MIFFLPILIGFIGCTNTPQAPSPFFNTILIKNSSSQHIKTFFISTNAVGSTLKEGSISPLLAHTQQTFQRPSQAKRLPDILHVRWISYDNQIYTQKLNMLPLVQRAKETGQKTLIFDIQTPTQLDVYLTNTI